MVMAITKKEAIEDAHSKWGFASNTTAKKLSKSTSNFSRLIK